jgi:2-keto-3-deoxy-L-rhamnonate aldolase RhmA
MFSLYHNPLRERIATKKTSFGIFVSEIRTPWLGTMLNTAGYDFCILDMEHGAFSFSEISGMLSGFQGGNCTPIVRVPAIRRDLFLPLLDLGIGGIMVPNIETANEVQSCLDFMKYPPLGTRGLSFSRPHTGFTSPERNRFLNDANERNLLIIQIESPNAVENLDEILSVSGIDAVFIGCADLSLSLKIPNDPANKPLRNILEQILRKTTEHGLCGGANITQKNLIESLAPNGLHLVTCTTDTKGFLDGITRPLKMLQQ